MQRGGAASEDDSGERTFAEADFCFGAGGGHKKRTEKTGEVRIVADDEEVLAFGAVVEELLEVFEGRFGGEGVGVEDLRLVTGFGADERCGLKTALERT